jgi:hypothetical protein
MLSHAKLTKNFPDVCAVCPHPYGDAAIWAHKLGHVINSEKIASYKQEV